MTIQIPQLINELREHRRVQSHPATGRMYEYMLALAEAIDCVSATIALHARQIESLEIKTRSIQNLHDRAEAIAKRIEAIETRVVSRMRPMTGARLADTTDLSEIRNELLNMLSRKLSDDDPDRWAHELAVGRRDLRARARGVATGNGGGEYQTANMIDMRDQRIKVLEHEVSRQRAQIETARQALEEARSEKRDSDSAHAREIAVLAKYDGEQLRKATVKLETAQAALDKFTGACADQTVQIAELRGEIMRMRSATSGEVAREQHKAEKYRVAGKTLADEFTRIAACAACAELGDNAPPDNLLENNAIRAKLIADAIIERLKPEVLTPDCDAFRAMAFDAIAPMVELLKDHVTQNQGEGLIDAAIRTIAELRECADCKNYREELAEVREQLGVADSDRVPLRMDLDEREKELARMRPLVDEVSKWTSGGLPDNVTEALDTYTKACAADADDVAF